MPPVTSTSSAFQCAQCGAKLRADAVNCWLCHTPIDLHLDREAPPAASHAQSGLPISAHGFSLASLMMLMTLVAVVLGLFSVAPGVGLLATIALVPAVLRAAWEIQQRKRRGQAPTIDEKVIVFAASLGVVVVAGVAAAIAFSATCWGGFFTGAAFAGPEEYGFLVWGAIIGGLIGTGLGGWVFYRVMKALAPNVTNKPSPWLFVAGVGALFGIALLWYLAEWIL